MGVTLQFIPYSEVEQLSPDRRIQKLLNSVRDDKIVLLQGQLPKKEEAELIQKTMETIDENFQGIEHAVILPRKRKQWHQQLRSQILTLLGHSSAFTVIGPANIVKEIKKNPDKIELLMKEKRRKRK